jgi:membrane-bound metal-dependent hydrolase YbcI (DUF457 family)
MGAAIGVLAVPSVLRPRVKVSVVFAFVVLANLPDLQLPHWGHDRYDISHSIFVNTALILLLALPLLLAYRTRSFRACLPVTFCAALAWLSHLLLDTFYNHGNGLGMFWPFSTAHFALPIPWFETLRKPLPHIDSHTAQVLLIELLSYCPLLCMALVARLVFAKNRKSGKTSDQPDIR